MLGRVEGRGRIKDSKNLSQSPWFIPENPTSAQSLANGKTAGEEERPGGNNTSEEIVRYTDRTTLNDAQSAGLNGRSHIQFVVSPDNGLDQLLPISPSTEQEHEAEGKDKVSGEEHDAIGRQGGTVGVDDVGGLGPEEVPQPAIDGDGTLGKVT